MTSRPSDSILSLMAAPMPLAEPVTTNTARR